MTPSLAIARFQHPSSLHRSIDSQLDSKRGSPAAAAVPRCVTQRSRRFMLHRLKASTKREIWASSVWEVAFYACTTRQEDQLDNKKQQLVGAYCTRFSFLFFCCSWVPVNECKLGVYRCIYIYVCICMYMYKSLCLEEVTGSVSLPCRKI